MVIAAEKYNGIVFMDMDGNILSGPFLTAMTFFNIRVEFYMTKFSFLTAFYFCASARPKTHYTIPRGAIFD